MIRADRCPAPISAPLRLCGSSSSPDEFQPAEAVVGVEAAVEDGVGGEEGTVGAVDPGQGNGSTCNIRQSGLDEERDLGEDGLEVGSVKCRMSRVDPVAPSN